MKIVYIAEKEELQELIKESIHEKIQTFLKGLNQKTIPERLSLIEAAQYLVVSKSYMYKFTHTRKIPFFKFGNRVFFCTIELDDWVSNQSHQYRTMDDIVTEHLSAVARKKLNKGYPR